MRALFRCDLSHRECVGRMIKCAQQTMTREADVQECNRDGSQGCLKWCHDDTSPSFLGLSLSGLKAAKNLRHRSTGQLPSGSHEAVNTQDEYDLNKNWPVSTVMDTGCPCHCQHQSLLAVGEHVLASRATSLVIPTMQLEALQVPFAAVSL